MGMFEPIAALGPGWVFVINLVCVAAGGMICIVIIIRILRQMLKKSSAIDNAIITFIVNAVKVACMIILITIILQMFGVSMSTIVAVVGTAGAAIALAIRDSLANIAGGVMIIVTHPFRQGDMIRVGEDRGIVEKIDLFLTTLRATDYKTITIPNGVINTSVIYNETDREVRRIDCEFTINYDTEVEKAKKVLREVCRNGEIILNDPEPWIGVTRHEENGMVVECLAYCKQEDQWDARYYLNEAVKAAFEEAGIEFPSPHLDVNVVKRDGI